MFHKKITIGVLSALLLLLACLCIRMDEDSHQETVAREAVPPIAVILELDQETEKITPWQTEDGNYVIVLPAGAQLQDAKLQLTEKTELLFDRVPLDGEMACETLQLGAAYPVAYGDGTVYLTILQAGELPSAYVDTNSGGMAYIHSYKENEEPGILRIRGSEGELLYSGLLESVKGRGNATWEEEKKPYNLKLKTEADLLGMGTAQNWVLLANAYDPTHIRNKLIYDTARELGMAYSPESQWVDLYLNGEYAGVYLLCEKNEIHPNRVDIDETTSSLISIEKEDRLWTYGQEQFLTEGGTPIRVRHGDTELARAKLQTLENAILADDGVDPVTGASYLDMIDLDSWVRKYLIEEVFGNLDAGSISQFFYWDEAEGGTIFAGPVWDYDITMGNRAWQLDSPRTIFAGREHLWDPEDQPWFYALYQKAEFRTRLVELYEMEFRPTLETLLNSEMQAYSDRVSQSAALDQLRWDGDDPAQATAEMLEYMGQRIEFLDALWLQNVPYHQVLLYIHYHVMACYAIPDGGFLPEREVYGGTDTIYYEAWCDAETDQPYDFSQPVTKDKLIYLKEIDLSQDPTNAASGFGLRTFVKYAPAAAILLLMLALGWTDQKRRREGGNDRNKATKISA